MLMIFYTISSVKVSAQWQKVNYNELNGLQNSLVKSITKDRYGFMWLATDDGLIRFDGMNFTQIKKGLPSSYVKSVFTTTKGNTLATTDLGVVLIDTEPSNPSIETLIQGDNYASDTLMWFPKSIYESINNNVWITDNHSIYKLDSSLQLLNRYQFSARDLPTNFQRSFVILEDPVLGIYTFSEAGYLYKYDQKKDDFYEIPLLSNNERINHAFFYQGKIIVATQSGVFEIILNKEGEEVLSQKVIIPYLYASYIDINNEMEWIASTWSDGVYKIKVSEAGEYEVSKMDVVEQKVISSVFVDEAKNIWLATDNGVIYLREQYFNAPFSKLSTGYIQNIIKDENKILFTDGHSVFFCDGKSNQLLDQWQFPKKYGIILRMKKINNQYWFSTNIGMLLVYTAQGELQKVFDFSSYGGAIYSMAYSPTRGLWYTQDHGGVFNLHRMKYPVQYGRDRGVTSTINIIKIIDGDVYLGGSKDSEYFFKLNLKKQRFENLSKPVALNRNVSIGINDFILDGKKFLFATNFGIGQFERDSLIEKKIKNLHVGAVKGIIKDHREENTYWFSNSMGLIRVLNWENYLVFDEISGVPSKTMVYRGVLLDQNDEIWVGTASGVGVSKKVVKIKNTPSPIFTSIKGSSLTYIKTDQPEISSSSYLEFEFASLSYPGNLIKYQVRYNNGEWRELGWTNKFIASGLQTGNYQLELKAKQTGEYMWSQPTTFNFIVSERWYRTWYGILGAFAILLGVGFIIFKLYDEKNQHDKEILEKLVSERTEEVKQKNKILSNRELILKKQVSKFMALNEKLNYQKNEIIEQLDYAHSLQSVVLPSLETFNEYCSDSFVLFHPKETVSGDFYWEKSFKGDHGEVVSYYVVGDSIGHGIPGVIQSIIGMELLNEIVRSFDIRTNEILELLDQKLFEKAEKDPTMIGMDLIVLRVTRNQASINVEYSGARRPLFYIQNNQLIEIKGTRRAIGNEPPHVKAKGFKVHQLEFTPKTIVYLTTNGFYDQFNSKEKRIGISEFRKILEQISEKDQLSEQKKWLEDYFFKWKGKSEQIDDVTILGLRM